MTWRQCVEQSLAARRIDGFALIGQMMLALQPMFGSLASALRPRAAGDCDATPSTLHDWGRRAIVAVLLYRLCCVETVGSETGEAVALNFLLGSFMSVKYLPHGCGSHVVQVQLFVGREVGRGWIAPFWRQ